MKHLLGVGLSLILAVSPAAAQSSKIYSTPTLPSREVLDRLNLRMAWFANVPMDGSRDGFISVQLDAGQVVATTRSGAVAAYDAETGRELWKSIVGKPSQTVFAPALNSRSVFVVNAGILYALNRANGAVRWQYQLPFSLSAPGVADERQLYLPGVNSRVAAYQLPLSAAQANRDAVLNTDAALETNAKKERDELLLGGQRPEQAWGIATNLHLDYPLIQMRDTVFFATPGGTVGLLGKFPLTAAVSEIYRFPLGRGLNAAPGSYDDMAYLSVADLNLHAVHMPSGKTRWRYAAGAALVRPPFAIENDVYITVEQKGLIRLDRETGEAKWKLPYGRTTTNAVAEAERVIAVNNKFVYAGDRAGRLLVLDRDTGRQLSNYTPFRDFAFPIANESTDRLLFAANNGLILCLHDREYDKPLNHRPYDTTKPSENRIKALQEKLARKVSEKAFDALPLAEVLESFRRRYGIDIFVSDRAFIDVGFKPVRDKPVVQERVENLEVGAILKGILAQVGATYEVVGEVVQVLPAKKEGEPNMNPPPLIQDAGVRDLLAKRIDAPAIEKFSLSEILLDQYALRFNAKIEFDKEAFKAVGLDAADVAKKEVVHPKGKGQAFSQVLKNLLDQAQAGYEVRGDTIMIVPAKK